MISIVMTHYNRTHLLERTLFSLTLNKTRDFEVVLVDDASTKEELEKLRELKNEYEKHFIIRLITINETEKWYDNPCIPFNIGLKAAAGDITIIQNAECYHLGNIVDYIEKRKDYFEPDPENKKELNVWGEHNGKYIDPNIQTYRKEYRRYMSFACYNINKDQCQKITQNPPHEEVLDIINPIYNHQIIHGEGEGWFDHPDHRPLGYHWCNAYATKDLKKLKYFDERFSKGTAYDDDDLAFRTKKILNTIWVNSPMVIHQWHGLGNYYKNPNQNENQLKQDYNRCLYEKVTKIENENEVNFENVHNKFSPNVRYNEE